MGKSLLHTLRITIIWYSVIFKDNTMLLLNTSHPGILNLLLFLV